MDVFYPLNKKTTHWRRGAGCDDGDDVLVLTRILSNMSVSQCAKDESIIWHLLKFNQMLMCVYVPPFSLAVGCSVWWLASLVVCSIYEELCVCYCPGVVAWLLAQHKIGEDVKPNQTKPG